MSDNFDYLIRTIQQVLDNQDEINLLKLQDIISDKAKCRSIYQNAQSKLIIQQLTQDLRISVLKSQIYSQLQTAAQQYDMDYSNPSQAILNLKGEILWCDQRAHTYFSIPNQKLLSKNFFQLIDPSSQDYISNKLGSNILDNRDTVVISYLSKKNQTPLTSRCTLISVKPGTPQFFTGIFLQTRHSKHHISQLRRSPRKSPMYSIQPISPQFGLISGNNFWHSFSGTPMSDLKITPSPFPVTQNQRNDIFACNSSFGNNFVSPFKTTSPGPTKRIKRSDDFGISTFE